MDEVIIASGAHCCIYNADTGNQIRVLIRNQELQTKTMTLIGQDYVLGAFKDKPVLKVLTVSKKIGNTGDFTIPGCATALGATSCGMFCFAGIGKELYVWKVTTGNLLAIVPSHYQEITCIKCSSDDSHVLTGGKDGHVYVWLLTDLVAVNRASNQKKPRFTWTNHSADITDIHVTSLGNYARVATVSSDMTCRLYELSSGKLITTICMEVPLTAVTMDTLEAFVFIGDCKGSLHRINIYEKLPTQIHNNEMSNSELKIHEGKIISLHTFSEGSRLVSSDDKFIKVWDIQSLSCLLTIPVEGGITNAFLASKPVSLVDDSIKPFFDICYFKRSLEESKNRKMTCTKIWKTKLSDMQRIPVEVCYNASIYNKSIDTKADTSKGPNQFANIVIEHTVDEMARINYSLYSMANNLYFNDVSQNSEDEKEKEEMDL